MTTRAEERFAGAVSERDRLRKENDVLRGMAATKMPCHYCGAKTMGECPRGFPGCALADDLMAAEETQFKALMDECERLRQYHDWAEPQISDRTELLAKCDRLKAIIDELPEPQVEKPDSQHDGLAVDRRYGAYYQTRILPEKMKGGA
jgi:hypothetical protein